MIEVLLGEDYWGHELKVMIVNRVEHGGDLALQIGADGRQDWEPIDQEQLLRPTILLPHGCGRAMLDALTRHYHGADDARALRRDYEAERARVDRYAELCGDVLRTLTSARAAS